MSWENIRESQGEVNEFRLTRDELIYRYKQDPTKTSELLKTCMGQLIFFYIGEKMYNNGGRGFKIQQISNLDKVVKNIQGEFIDVWTDGGLGTLREGHDAIIFINPVGIPFNGKKYKRIEHPDIDPFGEDDWGWEEVKESHGEVNRFRLTRDELIRSYQQDPQIMSEFFKTCIGQTVIFYLNGNTHDNNGKGYIIQKINGPDKIRKVGHYDIEIWVKGGIGTLRKGDDAIIFMNPIIHPFDMKKYKKIEHPDIDPFGEDDWGWEEVKENKKDPYTTKIIKYLPNPWEEVKESSKTPTKIEILPKLSKHVMKHDWSPSMLNMIGKEYEVSREVEEGFWVKIKYPGYDNVFNTFFIPKDSARITNRKKIERPDIDPFKEEEWGYEEVKENHKFKLLEEKIILKPYFYSREHIKSDTGEELIKELNDKFIGYILVENEDPGSNFLCESKKYYLSNRSLKVEYNNRVNGRGVNKESIKNIDISDSSSGDVTLLPTDTIYLLEKKKPFRRFDDIDPYGEEDWEDDIMESSEEEINKLLDDINKSKDSEKKYKLSRILKERDKKLSFEKSDNLKLSDTVIYLNPRSKFNEKTGYISDIRNGKFVIVFNNGCLVCSDTHLYKVKRTKGMKDVDPHNEEIW